MNRRFVTKISTPIWLCIYRCTCYIRMEGELIWILSYGKTSLVLLTNKSQIICIMEIRFRLYTFSFNAIAICILLTVFPWCTILLCNRMMEELRQLGMDKTLHNWRIKEQTHYKINDVPEKYIQLKNPLCNLYFLHHYSISNKVVFHPISNTF